MDWYLQLEPADAYKKSPEQLAAISFFVLLEVKCEKGDFSYEHFSKEDLSKFAGWKSNNINSAGHKPYWAVWRGVSDRDLLFIEPKKDDEDEID